MIYNHSNFELVYGSICKHFFPIPHPPPPQKKTRSPQQRAHTHIYTHTESEREFYRAKIICKIIVGNPRFLMYNLH